MKKLMVLLTILLFCGCNGQYAVTGMGSSDNDAGVSLGKVVNDNVEVGLTGISYDINGDHSTSAVGPYAAYLIDKPLPEGVTEDWRPFAGGAMLFSVDNREFEPIPQLFGGVIYKPHDVLSPVYIYEKQFPSGAIDSPEIQDRGQSGYHLFGLRYRF